MPCHGAGASTKRISSSSDEITRYFWNFSRTHMTATANGQQHKTITFCACIKMSVVMNKCQDQTFSFVLIKFPTYYLSEVQCSILL